jgi:hypothetical protein
MQWMQQSENQTADNHKSLQFYVSFTFYWHPHDKWWRSEKRIDEKEQKALNRYSTLGKRVKSIPSSHKF